jgi:hypothetical protein
MGLIRDTARTASSEKITALIESHIRASSHFPQRPIQSQISERSILIPPIQNTIFPPIQQTTYIFSATQFIPRKSNSDYLPPANYSPSKDSYPYRTDSFRTLSHPPPQHHPDRPNSHQRYYSASRNSRSLLDLTN